MFTTAPPAAWAPTSSDSPAADTTGGPAPRPARGPVLIGDLIAATNGRPLFLTHWDREDGIPERR